MEQVLVELETKSKQRFKMNLTLPGQIEEAIRAEGGWELYLASQLSDFTNNGGLFLDIGANIGYHSLYVAATNPQATCIAFEPSPYVYGQLTQNISLNEFTNISTCCRAVSNYNGILDFYMQFDTSFNRGLSSLNCYEILEQAGFSRIQVPVVTLDSYLDDNQKSSVKVIKIDTQGSEYEVLVGAKQLIEIARPVIVFEYHTGISKYSLTEIIGLIPQYTVYYHSKHVHMKKFTNESDPDIAMFPDFVCLP